MPAIDQLTAVWKNIREFELEPVRKEALRALRIVIIGKSGAERLAEQLQGDIFRTDTQSVEIQPGIKVLAAGYQPTVVVLGLEQAAQAETADLIILMVDPTEADLTIEQMLCRAWGNAGKRVLLFCNCDDLAHGKEVIRALAPWNASGFVCLPVEDSNHLVEEFVPAVLNLLPPEMHLALGRQLPLFRVNIARKLISDTCYNNAAYALGSGLAEVVPALNLPLNVADMIVLTKSQAFLAYRMGLLVGFSTAWQDYLAEFGSVVGSGFLWRQLARSLVGLIPVWGIVPKVAVAYAGTFVVGNSILQWYLTGRHLNPRQIRALYRQALAQGKQTAQQISKRLPRVKARKAKTELPAPQEIALPLPEGKTCPACGLPNAEEAQFCMHCGVALASGG
jgi:uncharacterized protein (DUF697 family)